MHTLRECKKKRMNELSEMLDHAAIYLTYPGMFHRIGGGETSEINSNHYKFQDFIDFQFEDGLQYDFEA